MKYLILLLFLLTACADDPGAHYTCFGGVKVQSLDECDFSSFNQSIRDCDKTLVYETGSMITSPNEVMMPFETYAREYGVNVTFVNAEYHDMIDGIDYYQFNFFDYDELEKKQWFMDKYGAIYKVNCGS